MIKETMVAVCLVMSAGAAAAQDTLADIVERNKGGVETTILREISPAANFGEILKETDLIVRAVVVDNGRSYLTEDKKSISSDYTLQILDQVFSTHALKPGQTISVTKPGGTLTLKGHEVTARERDFPPFQMGEEYFLCLKLDKSTAKYLVSYGAQGAFRVEAGEVDQVSRMNPDKSRKPVLTFIQELADAVKIYRP